jgi:ABC-2 type transport system ATP-binding protein
VRLFAETLTRQRRDLLQAVGALVEEPSLYPHLTGRENLEIVQLLRNCTRQDVDAVLEQFEFASAARDRVATYSSGMRQTLGLAVASLGQPRLLILDEPTNGLDPGATRKLRALLRRMVEGHGVTVFVSSHILGEIEQLADWVGIIDHGRLLFQGTLTSLRSLRAGSLEDVFLELVAAQDPISS